MPGVPCPRSIVAEQDGRPVGLAQMRPRREPSHWEVVYLAVEPLASPTRGKSHGPSGLEAVLPEPAPVPDRRAARLLGELCDACVAMGGERLFARIPDDQGPYELFRQVGFLPVVRELTYYRPNAAGKAEPARRVGVEDVPGLRPQQRSDAFGLLQLYLSCTPKMVQMAEGKRSQSWEVAGQGFGQRLARRPRVQRWVVEAEGRKVAWLQVHAQRRGSHAVRLLVDDRAGQLLEPLLDFALTQLAGQAAPGVALRVREHQERLIGLLEQRGFVPVETSLVMVKQLAAPVVQPQLARAFEKVV